MKLKLDENMPASAAVYLRDAGYEADTVVEEGLRGVDDGTLSRVAMSERRILLTYDADFADIRSYPLGSHAGIVIFRLQDQRWTSLKDRLRALIDSGVLRQLNAGLAVVTESRIRTHVGVTGA